MEIVIGATSMSDDGDRVIEKDSAGREKDLVGIERIRYVGSFDRWNAAVYDPETHSLYFYEENQGYTSVLSFRRSSLRTEST